MSSTIQPINQDVSSLIHEELFDGISSKIGCQCNKHGGGWIQCTYNKCEVWHCMDDITDTYVLLEEEMEALQESNSIFKCILHGFGSMEIGHKSAIETDTNHVPDNNESETYHNQQEEYKPNPSKHKSETNNKTYNTRKRALSPFVPLPPAKKRKINCNDSYLSPPPLEPHTNTNSSSNSNRTSNRNTNSNIKSHIVDGRNVCLMTKAELKALCSKKRLKVSGNKPELIHRLLQIPLMEIPYDLRKKHIVCGYCREYSSAVIDVIVDMIRNYVDITCKYETRLVRYGIIRNIEMKMSELGSPLRQYYDRQKKKEDRVRKRVSLADCFKVSDNAFDGDEQNFLELFGTYLEDRHKTRTGYKMDLKVTQFCEALGREWRRWWFRIYPSNSAIGVRLDKRVRWMVIFNVYTQSVSFSGGLQNTGPYM